MCAEIARAYAPGGIGNIGPGLDILGCALTGAGDEVSASWADAAGVHVDDPGDPELPVDPALHTSAIAATHVLRLAFARRAGGASDARGIALRVRKGLPLAGGQGGSAASAVAGAVAANALLGSPLGERDVLAAALAAESQVAGRHADNVAPALMGGIVLVHTVDPLDVVRLPVPRGLRVVLVQPAQQLATKEARTVLPATLERGLAMQQAAHVAGMVAAFASGDLELLRRALNDRIAEPARAPLLRGFAEAKAAALGAGAFGCSISGAGPAAFAFASDHRSAMAIGDAMAAAYGACGVGAKARVARIDTRGATVEAS